MSQHNETRSVEQSGVRTGEAEFADFAYPSGPIPTLNLSEPEVKVEPQICEYCGTYITDVDQRCAALHNGGCRP